MPKSQILKFYIYSYKSHLALDLELHLELYLGLHLEKHSRCELRRVCEVSENGYLVVIYVKNCNNSNTDVKLLIAKTRLASELLSNDLQ